MIFHPLPGTIAPTSRMGSPFSDHPHPLCCQAATLLQQELPVLMRAHPQERGKMFGVLVVRHQQQIGYLQAYSGQIDGGYPYTESFVPPVYNYLSPTGHFKEEEAAISQLNRQLSAMEDDATYCHWKKSVAILAQQRDNALEAWKKVMATAKEERDKCRHHADAATKQRLIRESQYQKAQLRRIRQRWEHMLHALQQRLVRHQNALETLKKLRKEKSDHLQTWLFDQFQLVNSHGASCSLRTIFASYDPQRPYLTPPAGTGECCEPKLLQYAFLHHMQPLGLAMFWWGESPEGEIRHHKQYYPACQSKCAPILHWMLQGMEVAPAPTLTHNTTLDILYEDADLAVINKPAGLLSVPGRDGSPSVEALLRARYPETAGIPIMVHRLDRDTSGLLVIAKNKETYCQLQHQFAAHTIEKSYVARLAPKADTEQFAPKADTASGRIDLPLAPLLHDRPRQGVDKLRGKRAVTFYTWLDENHVRLTPLTGRTHQLRVHCAHPEGLGRPILGDMLYGQQAQRLYLHAETLTFTHPATGKRMTFHQEADFRD